MTSCECWAHINLGPLLPRKRLKGCISDGHPRFTSILAKGLGNIKELCDERLPSNHRAGSPSSSWPSWPATAPQGRNQTAVMWNHRLHSPPSCPGASLSKTLLGSVAWPLQCLQVPSPVVATLICYVYSFLFLQNDNVSVNTVKSSPLEKKLNCLRALQSRSKRSITTVRQNSWVALARSC